MAWSEWMAQTLAAATIREDAAEPVGWVGVQAGRRIQVREGLVG